MRNFVSKLDWHEYQKEIQKRRITCLIHFTENKNLLSILTHGFILSRDRLQELDQDKRDFTEINDILRLDKLTDYINLSVEFPNVNLLAL